MNNPDSITQAQGDGLSLYEYLVNCISASPEDIDKAVRQLIDTDTTGQFCASASRYLAAVDKNNFAAAIDLLLKATIEKDRELAYLPDLLPAVWGTDYSMRVDELRDSDDNFRRIYKRVHPSGII